jgi:hypothetical protein
MLLTPNILTASLLSHDFSGSVFGSILISVLTYFVLNLIPHWDPQNHNRLIVKIARYLDFAFSASYLAFMVIVLFQPDSSLNFTLNSQEVNFNLYSVLGAFVNAIIYLAFYAATILNIKNKFIKKLISFDITVRYHDRSLWGILVQIGLTILSLTLLFRLIGFPSWDRIFGQMFR